jgi:NAD-dependent dihydropyrimidine dehydrogenase PreA subunit
MNGKEVAFHYVCTRDEARELVKKFHRFWVSNCGCRQERGGKCRRSRMDLCLMFRDDIETSGTGMKEVSFSEVEEIFRESQEAHLVTRPFRDEETKTRTEGICFCCDDCCGYFQNEDGVCDKGKLIERTRSSECTNCGECVEVCYFGARQLEGDELIIDRDNCYGCGLCVDICPMEYIEMVVRG